MCLLKFYVETRERGPTAMKQKCSQRPSSVFTATCSWCVCWFGALPLLPACSWWPLKSRVSFPSISGAVILTAKCRHHHRNKLTPFHRVRVQPRENPNCPLRQIETDSTRKRCRRKRQTNSGEVRERERGRQRWLNISEVWCSGDSKWGENIQEIEKGADRGRH